MARRIPDASARRVRAGDRSGLGNPLDYIAEDHIRERLMCDRIDAIASGEAATPEQAETVRSYLHEAFLDHIGDDCQSLFPLMRQRCTEDDNIEQVIERITSDHVASQALARPVVAVLGRLAEGGACLTDKERNGLTHFAAHARRHLTVENAILLPLARMRLKSRDLVRLRRDMLRRRGLDRITETDDAQ